MINDTQCHRCKIGYKKNFKVHLQALGQWAQLCEACISEVQKAEIARLQVANNALRNSLIIHGKDVPQDETNE